MKSRLFKTLLSLAIPIVIDYVIKKIRDRKSPEQPPEVAPKNMNT